LKKTDAHKAFNLDAVDCSQTLFAGTVPAGYQKSSRSAQSGKSGDRRRFDRDVGRNNGQIRQEICQNSLLGSAFVEGWKEYVKIHTLSRENNHAGEYE
jgi:hypothetical protein